MNASCDHCGCYEKQQEFKRCNRCKIVYYCSEQCQRADWLGSGCTHKKKKKKKRNCLLHCSHAKFCSAVRKAHQCDEETQIDILRSRLKRCIEKQSALVLSLVSSGAANYYAWGRCGMIVVCKDLTEMEAVIESLEDERRNDAMPIDLVEQLNLVRRHKMLDHWFEQCHFRHAIDTYDPCRETIVCLSAPNLIAEPEIISTRLADRHISSRLAYMRTVQTVIMTPFDIVISKDRACRADLIGALMEMDRMYKLYEHPSNDIDMLWEALHEYVHGIDNVGCLVTLNLTWQCGDSAAIMHFYIG